MFFNENAVHHIGVIPVDQSPIQHSGIRIPTTNSVDENPPDDQGGAFSNFGDNVPYYGLVAIVTVPGTRILEPWGNYEPLQVPNFDPGWDGIPTSASSDGNAGEASSPCATPGNHIDWAEVTKLEGNNLLKGNIPNNGGIVIGRSGVTIAAGFDIGQHSAQEIHSMHLPPALEAKLLPYVSPLIKQEALEFLESHPLTITFDESVAINAAAHANALAHLQVAYDNSTGIPGAFYELPANTQTALMSMAFQVGSIEHFNSQLWNDLTHFRWNEAVTDMQHLNGYTIRRGEEANLIQSDQAAGLLKTGKLCAGS